MDEIHPQISHAETMAILEKHFDTQEEICRRNSLWEGIRPRNPLWEENYRENSEISTDGFGTHDENKSSFYPMWIKTIPRFCTRMKIKLLFLTQKKTK